MKKPFLATVLLAIGLSACGGVDARVPDDTYAKESQAIAEKWISANHELDAQALLSLYSKDLTWRDCGMNYSCDVLSLADLQGVVPLSFRNEGFTAEADSYMVTNGGRFAVLQVMYADPGPGGPTTPIPATVLLEFKDGGIVNETWYYILP
jgi:hypothetical protein